ncbi:hypothetical protein Dda_9334 [Drechslerella dactyloides]|uniref:Uncharacterized protein n=1 Tax=Drechslerella dactyloides TaxID=74499 RepID=A0AAD6IPD9_DREDA|nr:hypothetical protein Dda_9334 [Drechslerella dactyloides]
MVDDEMASPNLCSTSYWATYDNFGYVPVGDYVYGPDPGMGAIRLEFEDAEAGPKSKETEPEPGLRHFDCGHYMLPYFYAVTIIVTTCLHLETVADAQMPYFLMAVYNSITTVMCFCGIVVASWFNDDDDDGEDTDSEDSDTDSGYDADSDTDFDSSFDEKQQVYRMLLDASRMDFPTPSPPPPTPTEHTDYPSPPPTPAPALTRCSSPPMRIRPTRRLSPSMRTRLTRNWKPFAFVLLYLLSEEGWWTSLLELQPGWRRHLLYMSYPAFAALFAWQWAFGGKWRRVGEEVRPLLKGAGMLGVLAICWSYQTSFEWWNCLVGVAMRGFKVNTSPKISPPGHLSATYDVVTRDLLLTNRITTLELILLGSAVLSFRALGSCYNSVEFGTIWPLIHGMSWAEYGRIALTGVCYGIAQVSATEMWRVWEPVQHCWTVLFPVAACLALSLM